MRLYLINPANNLVDSTDLKASRWNRYRVWKPLGLLVVAALTPPDWEVTIIDENLGLRDYAAMPRADLVGITAFTSQAPRAYELAAQFRRRGVMVVMGGIHATMCCDEAMEHVDAVVMGEAESVWAGVLNDARRGVLQRTYTGEHADMAQVPLARHDLLTEDYAFGSVQTTRGCPLDCTFCSVSAFNGKHYRHRPIEHVVQEMQAIREKWLLVVDDNLIGTSPAHIARAKELFRAMIQAGLRKKWVGQVTINMADDEELLSLAAAAGCIGVFIGFESPSAQGLAEIGKRFNMLKGRNCAESVRRIQRHKIMVVGSFILGLDTDEPGIGRRIARAARSYGVDALSATFLTPLPGTRLWRRMQAEGRIAADGFPAAWRYYTFNFPTARYRNFSWAEMCGEMKVCEQTFYSLGQVLRRVARSTLRWRRPLFSLVANLSYRNNALLTHRSFGGISEVGRGDARGPIAEPAQT